MELVYLWIEEYKNIKNQGFNFSPRFYCEYKDNKLTISENKDYVHIFPENINITAIVGKNGSGKSSILESFGKFLHNVYYIFNESEQLYSNYFNKKIGKYVIHKKDIDINNIIYLNKMFFLNLNKGGLYSLLSLDEQNIYEKLFREKLDINYIHLNKNNFHKNMSQIILNDNLHLPYFRPNTIQVSFNYVHGKCRQIDKVNEIYRDYATKLINLSIKENKTTDDIKKEEELKKRLNLKTIYKVYLKSLEIIQENKNESIIKFCKQDIEKILNFHYHNNGLLYNILDYNDEDIYKFLNNFDNSDYLPYIYDKKHYKFKIRDFKKKFISQKNMQLIFNYLHTIGFIEYDFFDENGKSFSKLSSGEKCLFIDFNLIYEYIKNKINDNKNIELLLFLDEPDLTLHPDWQKKYVKLIIDFLQQKKFSNIKFHVVFTTHSPFLISDLPKENIIFLDTYKKNDKEVKNKEQKVGNCKVLTHNEVLDKKRTFGTNIHTLLSDSFFMQDGLMGEFAKSKINEILDCYKKVEEKSKNNNSDNLEDLKSSYEKKKKEFWEIQRIIGEDYLRQIIKNHLVEIEKKLLGKDKAKQKEIKRVEAYLESLKND